MVKIFITGTPGVGKTTIARNIAKKIGAKLISLGEFVKNRGALIGYDPKRDSFIVDIERGRQLLCNELRFVQNLVIEGHIVELVPQDMVDLVIVLRLNPLILKKRLEERGYSTQKIKENVESEVLDIILVDAINHFDFEKIFELDITNLSVEKATRRILEIIKEHKGPKPGSVNWLESLSKELENFLFSR